MRADAHVDAGLLKWALDNGFLSTVCGACHEVTLFRPDEKGMNMPTDCGRWACMVKMKSPLTKRTWKYGNDAEPRV